MSTSTVSSAVQSGSLQKGVAAATLGFGAAGLLAPNLLARTYGVRDPAPEFTYMARLWGSSLLVLGTLTLTAKDAEARRGMATAAVVMNAADGLSALTATGMPWSTRMMAAATSAAFGAANLAILGRAG
jgi:hypothetical protein